MIQRRGGWQYAGVYADNAISGTKNRRKDFQRMLEDCRAGKIDVIITNAVIMKGQFGLNVHSLINVNIPSRDRFKVS